MTSVGIEYVMGFEIKSHQKALLSDPPPSVSLRRMGGSEATTYFTPDEAEHFAEAVLRAAKAAREAR